jgi:4-hydroxy-2-oxoheptanedioate aldolase
VAADHERVVAVAGRVTVFLKDRIQSGDGVLRGVLSLVPSAVATQAIAAAGADFVLIDREHGPIDRETVHAMIAATAGTACAPLVRVPGIDEAEVTAALDAGAEGIVFPMIRTAEEAERCVSLTTYPPAGTRGWGPFVGHSRFNVSAADYTGAVAPRLTCSVLIETAEAVQNIDAILAVPGIDIAVIARYDLSMSLGVHGKFESQEFTDAVATVERAAATANVPIGGIALTPAESAALASRGYRLLVNAVDVVVLQAGVAAFRGW